MSRMALPPVVSRVAAAVRPDRVLRSLVLVQVPIAVCLVLAACLAGAASARGLELLGSVPGCYEDTACDGDLIYAAAGGGLAVIDFTGRQIAFLPLPGWPQAIDVDGGLACVAAEGLHVVDVSDPTAPRRLATCPDLAYAVDVELEGTIACVSDQASGLIVLSLQEPSRPAILGTLEGLGTLHELQRIGDLVYAASAEAGLQIIDVSDPTAPQRLGTLDTPGNAYGLAVAWPHAYVATGGSLLVVADVSDSAHPFTAATFPVGHGGNTYDIAVAGGFGYVAHAFAGLIVLDLQDPIAPVETGFLPIDEWNKRVTAAGELALISSTYYGLHAIDVAAPAEPAEAWIARSMGNARGARVVGGHALVPGGYMCDEKSREGIAGLLSIDLATPADPQVVNFLPLSGALVAIDCAASCAYTLDWYGSVTALDVGDPAHPIQVGSCHLPAYTYDLILSGSIAYVAAEAGLRVLDVANSSAPAVIGGLDLYEGGRSVALAGTCAYLTSGYMQLYIVDVADPPNPSLRGSLMTPSWSEAVVVDHDVAYVACGAAGLLAVDVSDPAAPAVLSLTDTPDYANDLAIDPPLIFVADCDRGVTVFNVSDPTAPQEVACHRGIRAETVDVQGDLVLVGSYMKGFHILDLDESAAAGDVPARTAALSASPNPFHDRTAFSFSLDAPARVSLAVYDGAGRRVRTLLSDEVAGAGLRLEAWDGLDDRGFEVPSGVYFVTLRCGSQEERTRLTRLR